MAIGISSLILVISLVKNKPLPFWFLVSSKSDRVIMYAFLFLFCFFSLSVGVYESEKKFQCCNLNIDPFSKSTYGYLLITTYHSQMCNLLVLTILDLSLVY